MQPYRQRRRGHSPFAGKPTRKVGCKSRRVVRSIQGGIPRLRSVLRQPTKSGPNRTCVASELGGLPPAVRRRPSVFFCSVGPCLSNRFGIISAGEDRKGLAIEVSVLLPATGPERSSVC